MDLEKKVNDNKPGILKRIVRRAMPYVLVASLGLAMVGCKEAPGPISVQNTITPTTVQSGSNIDWEVEVINYGGEVTIEQVTLREKIISGWAEGLPGSDVSIDLPITNDKISPHSTETIFSLSTPVYNTGPNNIIFKNTITVNSDGGDDSDTCTYTVLSSYSPSTRQLKDGEESLKAIRGVVQGLSDYVR